jgi:thiol-disulfide isomerase/thioredoxin
MKIDKLKIILMSVLVICSVATIGIYDLINKEEEVTNDAIKFKDEYESLNDSSNEDGKTYPSVSISTNNPIVYATYDEIFDILDGKTGVIYLGFPECPWCRNLVPNLLTAAKKVGIDKIYYINMRDERNILSLDDGSIVTEKEGTLGYNKLVEKLSDVLEVYSGLDDDSIKRIYVPFVIFVKDGEIVSTHLGTVDSQDDPYIELNEEQRIELINTLVEKFMQVTDSSCDSAC